MDKHTNISRSGDLVERLRATLPLLDGLEVGRDCEEYAYAKAGGFQAMTYCPDAFKALHCIPSVIDRIEALEAENERLREVLEPQWFYAGEDQSSDQCRFSIDEVLEDELCGWGPPKTGKHVVHVSTALPGPDIWVAVHVFTDEEKDARDDDETWNFQEFPTEAEARAALGASHD